MMSYEHVIMHLGTPFVYSSIVGEKLYGRSQFKFINM